MNLKRIFTFGFIAAVIIAIWYQPKAPFSDLGEAEGATSLQQFTLPNGLEVYVIPQHRTPAVNHTLWVKAGAADEPSGKTGVAHYLEHLMFKGTPEVPSGDYSKLIEGLGGTHNAFTSDDFTGYYVTIAKEHLGAVMQLEADRMMHIAPDAEESARELQVVLEERAQRIENRPAARLGEAMGKPLYGDHPYARPIIGWPEELAALTLEDAMAFYAEHYHAANMQLVLAGDVTLEEAKALAQKHYGALPSKAKNTRPWKQMVISGEVTEPVILKDAQVKQRQWVRHLLMPSMVQGGEGLGRTKQVMPLMLLSHMLGGSSTSALYQSLVVEQKIATDVSVSYGSMAAGVGRMSLSATPSEGVSMKDFERQLNTAIERQALHGFTLEELARAKVQFMAESIYARDGLTPLARFLGGLVVIDAPLEYYTHWDALVKRVTLAQVNESMSLLFSAKGVTGHLLPEAVEEAEDGDA